MPEQSAANNSPTVLGLSNHGERVESLGIEIGYVGGSRCHESWKDLRQRYSGQRSRQIKKPGAGRLVGFAARLGTSESRLRAV